MSVTNITSISMEWAAFIAFLALLWTTRDINSLFQHNQSSMLLTVPVLAIILPAFLQFPLAVPTALIIPHLILLTVLVLSLAIDLKQVLRTKK